MKKKIIKLLLITTLSTLILTGCKDSEETISNIDETTETTSVIESSEVAENTSDATTETASTSETSETESESNSASAIETSESETTSEIETSDSANESATEPVSTSTVENTSEENSSDSNIDTTTTTIEPVCTSAEFLAILNAKRTELGLSPVSLDANLDAIALSEVKILSTNFDGFTPSGNYDRCNRAKSMGNSNAQNAFDAWYGSEGHRRALMDPYLTHIATAYYGDGGYYIFIGNIDEEAYSRDLANQLNQNSTTTPTEPISSNDVGNGQTVDTSVTPGTEYTPTEEERQAAEDAFANW